jgi:hypothetical protein
MSRTRRDILDTEAMLERLTACLVKHHPDWRPTESPVTFDQCRPDAESLRRISMTLHRWHELECGCGNGHVERDETTGKTYWVNTVGHPYRVHTPDREKGALARLARIAKRYPSLQFYVQGDPRGCALYVLKPGDVPAGQSAGSFYSRGLAVHQ